MAFIEQIVSRAEEEEKGPGFSHLNVRLIVVEYPHTIDIHLYFPILVTPILYSSSGQFEATCINRNKVRGPVESVDEKNSCLPAKTLQVATCASIALQFALSARECTEKIHCSTC